MDPKNVAVPTLDASGEFTCKEAAMPNTVSLRERECERIAATLHFVADHIDRYMPTEVCLDGTEFVVRVPDSRCMPTVELSAEMPAMAVFKRAE